MFAEDPAVRTGTTSLRRSGAVHVLLAQGIVLLSEDRYLEAVKALMLVLLPLAKPEF